jgi:hypothetical protein
MTCHYGPGIVICDGRGRWKIKDMWCPWCCVKGETVRALVTRVYGGYGGFDAICGSCGFKWSADDEWRPLMNPHDNERREANIERVAAAYAKGGR